MRSMDYRKFLGVTQTMVLPYRGGPSVHAPDRRLRVTRRVAAGWWRFEIAGRHATPAEKVDVPSLDHLPAVRGHMVGDWLFTGGDTARRVYLMPEDEPPVLSPAVARRWPGDELVFDLLAFEDEAEDAARTALLDDDSVAGIKGVAPSLRGAFGYARLRREAARRGLQVSVREVLRQVHAVAEGTLDAQALLDEREARIFQLDPGSNHRARARPQPSGTTAMGTGAGTSERAAIVLEQAGAELVSSRQLSQGRQEVVFRYLGEQFIAVVDRDTLHVYDSGICLNGHDEQLGLDSLPSVISEAIDRDLLHITNY